MTKVVIRAELCLNITDRSTSHMPLVQCLHAVMPGLASLCGERIVHRLFHLAERTHKANHLQGGHSGLFALIAGLAARSLNSLLNSIHREYAKRYRNVALHTHHRNAFGALACDVFKVWGTTTNHRAEAARL